MDIRVAISDDWPQIAALLADLGRPDVRGQPDEEIAERTFRNYLRRSDVEAFVADIHGDVVGFVNVEYRVRLNYRAKQAWIGELIIARQHRRAGVGKALLQTAVDRARQAGCWGIALESANWRNDAHRFYTREGWAQTSLAFTKLIDPSMIEPGRKSHRQDS